MKKTLARLSLAVSLFFITTQHGYSSGYPIFSLVDSCQTMNFPVAPSDSCFNAPPFCASYLNGYCSVNNGYTADQAATLSCSIENNQWLSFIPCEDSISFIISVGNCMNINGLEFSILQSDDCLNFTPIQSCFSINDENIDTLSVANLIAGATYFLMIDGINGDICQWEIVSTFGISDGTFAQELITPGYINGECDICLDASGPPSMPFEYVAFPADCQLVSIDTSCVGSNDICPPAYQQFCEPHLDTLIQPTAYDTVWHITPTDAGYFVNDDSVGTTVEIIWDSIGTFYIDVELVGIEFDTIEYWDNCIKPCLTICPDPEGDNCDITRKTVNVGMPEDHFYFFQKCPEECVDIFINGGGGNIFEPAGGDTVSAGSITFCIPGYFDFYVVDEATCIDHYIVEIIEFNPQDQFVTLQEECPGDCVEFLGDTYCPGSYQVPSSDFNGCFIIIFLEVLPALGGDIFITAAPTLINCIQPEAFISVSSNYNGVLNYVWSDGSSGENLVVTHGGLFTVEAYDGNCLIDVQSVFIDEDKVSEIYDLGEIVLCPGDCYDLMGDQYCDEGVYNEQYINPINGCLDTYIFTIIIEMNPSMQIGPVSEVCDGLNETYSVAFSILGGTPPYKVNGIQISNDFYQSAPIPTGDPFLFVVEDNAGCVAGQETIQGLYECPCITDPGTMGLSILNQCENDMVEPNWNNDAVLDGNDILLFVLHTESGNLLGNVLGMNFTGTFGFEPGTMNYGQTYYISAIAGNENNGNVDYSSACFGVAAGQPVVFYSEPQFTIYPPSNITCDNPQEILSTAVAGGSGQFQFEWTGPGGYFSDEQEPTVAEGGDYFCIVTDLVSGCSTEESINIIEQTDEPDLFVEPAEITCIEPIVDLTANSTVSGVIFNWTLPDGSNAQTQTIQTDLVGSYQVVATAPNGCISTFASEVTENIEPPNVFVEDDTVACNQPIATLIANTSNTNLDLEWELPDGTLANGLTLESSLSGTYTLTAIAENGCDTVVEATVLELSPILTPILEVQPPECVGEDNGFIVISDVLGATMPIEVSVNGQPAPNGEMENLSSGTYQIMVIDNFGCSVETLITLDEPEEIFVNMGEDLYANAGDEVTIEFESNIVPSEVLWSSTSGQFWDNVNSINFYPEGDLTISLLIFDEFGCSVEDQVAVFVEGTGDVYIPNAFSPNGDLTNDKLTVYGGSEVNVVKSFSVFDRWGNLVYKGENFQPNLPQFGWDGTFNSKDMDTAVFGYIAEIEMNSGEIKLITGDVTLLK